MINVEEEEQRSSDVWTKTTQTDFLGDELKILDGYLSILIPIDAFPLDEREKRIRLTRDDGLQNFADLPENTFASHRLIDSVVLLSAEPLRPSAVLHHR